MKAGPVTIRYMLNNRHPFCVAIANRLFITLHSALIDAGHIRLLILAGAQRWPADFWNEPSVRIRNAHISTFLFPRKAFSLALRWLRCYFSRTIFRSVVRYDTQI